jgi:2-oxoglutarate dehydrogenase E2 component (dihydrolipoamide succinyltransferase)
VVEATVGNWLKHQGDRVDAGEALVSLETEKVNIEVAADQAGTLGAIAAPEGSVVHPGDVIATIEDVAPGASGVEQAAPQAAPAPPAPQPPVSRPHASPVARRIAEEHGLDLSRVEGTGTAGRVTREDVERYIQPAPAAAQPPPTPEPAVAADTRRPEKRIRMSRRRQTIATRLLEAQRTAAMLTTFNEVDMTFIMEIRARQREAFQKRHGVGLGFMSFFTRAVVGALRDFPNLNAEVRGDEIVQKGYYDIGIAVGAEGGLVVPIVRDADRKSFSDIEREIARLAEKARDNTLTLEDLRGGTFTITNGGVFGSLLSTPILSPPQVGILGMHKIQPRPVALDGQVAIRPMMYLALTYDHRIVDGREAVQFLVRVKELIEDPTALLLD